MHTANEFRTHASGYNVDMWRILTRKFKAQSLEDIPPSRTKEEDRDSGTESEEENAELQAIEEAMQARWDEEQHFAGLTSPMTGICMRAAPLRSQTRPLPTRPATIGYAQRRSSKRAVQAYTDVQSLRDNVRWQDRLDATSATDGCCALAAGRGAYISTGEDEEEDEEELSIINRSVHDSHPTKHASSSSSSSTSSSASCCSSTASPEHLAGPVYEPKPLKFISSPPQGVHKLRRILSPALFLAKFSSNRVGLYSFGHRKRHRHALSHDVSDALRIERPCLDFDKMRLEFCL